MSVRSRGDALLGERIEGDGIVDDDTVHDISVSDLDQIHLHGTDSPLIPVLTVLGGTLSGRVFQLRHGRNLVGRDPQAHIFLDSSRISRQHCEIYVTAIDPSVEPGSNIFSPKSCAEITDLKSTNGTRCNGTRLSPSVPHRLRPRDQIDLGGGATMAFGVMREEEYRHHVQLYRSANQDALTGAYNKRHTLIRLDEEFAWASRRGRPLSVIVLDLDHFKSINDTYGHDIGDIVLKSVARRVQGVLRREDLFGRFGGEEFVLLLRDTPPDAAMAVAERIRQKLSRWPITTPDGMVRVTASLGLACSDEHDCERPEDLFKLADMRLYRAKATGRDRVIGPTGRASLETAS